MVTLDGDPWFVAADVCKALGLAVTNRGTVNVTMALRGLDEDETGFINIETHPGTYKPKTKYRAISESGLYALIHKSRKPAAEAFKRWVRKEVLPAIRKDGAYIMGEEKVRSRSRRPRQG